MHVTKIVRIIIPQTTFHINNPSPIFRLASVSFQDSTESLELQKILDYILEIDRDQISTGYVRGEYNDIYYRDPDDGTIYPPPSPPGDRNGNRFNDWI